MTQVEQILNEIKKSRKQVEESSASDERKVASFVCLDHIYEFASSLAKEPQDANVEQASIEHAHNVYNHTAPGERIADCMYDFKAGAEWQKKQMMKDAVIIEDEFVMCYNNGEPTGLSPYEEWWETPEVQNKFKDGDKVKIIIIKE